MRVHARREVASDLRRAILVTAISCVPSLAEKFLFVFKHNHELPCVFKRFFSLCKSLINGEEIKVSLSVNPSLQTESKHYPLIHSVPWSQNKTKVTGREAIRITSYSDFLLNVSPFEEWWFNFCGTDLVVPIQQMANSPCNNSLLHSTWNTLAVRYWDSRMVEGKVLLGLRIQCHQLSLHSNFSLWFRI